MIKEEDVLAALAESRGLASLQKRLSPGSKGATELQELLLQMRTAGKLKFDIYPGK
jgi:hypothetical protein